MSNASWASSPAARARMRANRGRDTKPEIALRQALHRRGLRFFVNRRPVEGLRRSADILFPRARVAVFVDGCFWHGCPDHYTRAATNAEFWAEKVRTNIRRDSETNEALRREGWTVVRVWEHTNVAEAVAAVVSALTDQSSLRSSAAEQL